MPEETERRAALRQRSAELAVGLLLFALGALIVVESVRIGARWGEDGPQTGYFPFYVALILCLASAWNMAQAFLDRGRAGKTFVERGQLRLVLSVLVPAVVFVAAVGWIGLYLAGTAFIAFFMRWLGKYPWWKVGTVSFGVSVAFFVVFERWFLVPLPKGPIERVLGLG